jgi:hypothetical protein
VPESLRAHLRYGRWDLGGVDPIEARSGTILCTSPDLDSYPVLGSVCQVKLRDQLLSTDLFAVLERRNRRPTTAYFALMCAFMIV